MAVMTQVHDRTVAPSTWKIAVVASRFGTVIEWCDVASSSKRSL